MSSISTHEHHFSFPCLHPLLILNIHEVGSRSFDHTTNSFRSEYNRSIYPPLDESAIGVLSRLPSESEHFLEGRARCRCLGFFVGIVGLRLSSVIVFIVFTLSDIDVAGHCCAGLFVRFVPLLLSSWVR